MNQRKNSVDGRQQERQERWVAGSQQLCRALSE